MADDPRVVAISEECKLLTNELGMPVSVDHAVRNFKDCDDSRTFKDMLSDFAEITTCNEMLRIKGLGKIGVNWIRLWCCDNNKKMKCGCPDECPHKDPIHPDMEKKLNEMGYCLRHFRAAWMDNSNQELAVMLLEQFEKNTEIEIKLEEEMNWTKELETVVHSTVDSLTKMESAAHDLASSAEDIVRSAMSVDNR